MKYIHLTGRTALGSKKNEIFMKLDWTVYILLTILIGSFAWANSVYAENPEKTVAEKSAVSATGAEKKPDGAGREKKEKSKEELEAELQAVKEELSAVSRELANVLKESEKRDADYTRIKLSIAASLAEGTRKSYNSTGEDTLKALLDVSEQGDKLVATSAEFCDFIEALLDKKEITDVERVRAKFRMSQLREAAEGFHARIKKPWNKRLFKECRVLAVNDKLQVLILNVGSVYGMRVGLLLNGEKGSGLKLQVISVRPFISGAIVIKGNIEDAAPGMLVYAGH